MKFTIETVTKMTGISAASLRNWERRYGFPAPQRTEGGHRFYSAQDIEFLRSATKLIKEGYCLSEVGKNYQEQKQESIPMLNQVTDDVDYRTRLIYQALLNFDQAATLQQYQILNAKLSPEQLFDRVFANLLFRIQGDFTAKEISSTQYRFSLCFLRMKLSVFLAMEFLPTQSSRIIVANLWKHECESEIMLLSAHLKFRGYPVFHMGTGLQLADTPVLLEEIKPDVLSLVYHDRDDVMKDLEFLKTLSIPVYLCGAQRSSNEPESRVEPNIYFCQKSSGSEAALFIEMICRSKVTKK